MTKSKYIASLILLMMTPLGLFAEPAQGADAVPHLFAPHLAGDGGFTTTTGGAPASAFNPAQGGTASRMIFDAGYLAILSTEEGDSGSMHSLQLGALFPTRFAVFGGSMRFIGGNHDFGSFQLGNTFNSNLFAAKEIYPGMSLGVGFNLGFGSETLAPSSENTRKPGLPCR